MRKFFRHSRLLLLLVVILSSAGSAQAYGLLSDSLRTEIRKISAIMYDSCNPGYLDADALCDGLILLGQSYSLSCDSNGVLSIDGGPLPIFARQQYEDKVHLFLKKTRITSFSTTTDSLSLDKIFDEHSFFRTYRGNRVLKMPDEYEDKDISSLVTMLHANKLIDPRIGYHILLSSDGLFINDKKQDDAQLQYYLHALAKTDNKITEGNIPYLEVIHKPDGNKK